MRWTGFWEVNAPGEPPVVLTTMIEVEADELMERIRTRLRDLPPGAHVRIDLIAWDDPE